MVENKLWSWKKGALQGMQVLKIKDKCLKKIEQNKWGTHNSTSVWGVQHQNTGQNIQQGTYLHGGVKGPLCFGIKKVFRLVVCH